MSAADYFITPSDIGRSAQRIRWEHGLGFVAGLIAAFLVYKFTTLGAEAAIFAALLIALMVWRSDPRWLFGAAIGSFGAIIIVSSMWQDVEIFDKPLSERMAVWSFYFLVIGVMLLIIESYWPKDGTFNALQQKAPSAATDSYRNLPQHIKTKLKHQREEQAAAKAAASASTATAEAAGNTFKHPLFANGQPPLHQKPQSETTAAKPKRSIPEKPFQYIEQRPVVLRQPQPAPVLPGVVHKPVTAQSVAPRATVPKPAMPVTPATPQPAPAAPPTIKHTPMPVMQQQPVVPVASKSVQTKPKKFVQPPLLDLRAAPRMAPPSRTSIKVSVKSDSPLPSKRRKLVQL